MSARLAPQAGAARDRIARNPFYVLGLRPGASRAAIEEEAQKLLAMLELGLDGAAEYETPLGARTRVADDVRAALAELRDPERRAGHERWATLAPATCVDEDAPADGWPGAFAALKVGR